MATLAEIRATVDQAVLTLWPLIVDWQEDHMAAHGRAWQGLRTHSILPAEGASKPPDVGLKKPPDCAPWPAGFRTVPQPMALEVQAYDGPQGKGFIVDIGVTAEGETWHRSVQHGPETWHQVDWHQVVARPLP